jgi:hypothetical protein
MSAAFKRASIVPFDAAGKTPQEDQAIPFDFNPETLTLKVTASKAKDKQRKGRQQVQHVGTSEATLNFEAVFDSTRPRDGADGRAVEQEEKLDVRLRTKGLAALIQQAETQRGGGANKQPAPKRVQFRWGSIIFNGLITQYQETFDYFSPGGVPLRSKLQITLTEQEFRYEVNAADRAAARAATPPAPAGLRDAAKAAGAGSLLDMGPGGLSLGLSAELSLGLSAEFDVGFSAGVSLQANLGLSADIGLSAGAGISLSADAAVDVFGPAALGAGGGAGGIAGGGGAAAGTAGRAGLSAGTPSAAAGAASPWAPDGPAPGTRAAGLAAVVAGQRAAGTALAAPNTPANSMPLAPRGSPPPALPRAPAGAVTPALRSAPREVAWDGERRPRWEALALPAAATAIANRAHASGGGCGCMRCRGGH